MPVPERPPAAPSLDGVRTGRGAVGTAWGGFRPHPRPQNLAPTLLRASEPGFRFTSPFYQLALGPQPSRHHPQEPGLRADTRPGEPGRAGAEVLVTQRSTPSQGSAGTQSGPDRQDRGQGQAEGRRNSPRAQGLPRVSENPCREGRAENNPRGDCENVCRSALAGSVRLPRDGE